MSALAEERMKAIHIVVATLAVALAIAASTGSSRAQADYPARTVKLIVPYPPGGGTDLLARVLAQQLGEKWKQSVIVENVGGAEGNIGAEEVAHAAPDAYTLLFASPGPLALNSLVYKTMPYEPAKWVPIALVATSPYVLVVSSHFAATNLAGVIADAKAKPGALTAATPGVGGLGYFTTIEFEQLAHVKLLLVPYQGLGPEVADVLGGHVNMMFDMMATSLPLYRAGKEKIVAVGATRRVPELPDVPTLAEAGVPGFRAVTFFGIVAPPGTPDVLADRLNHDIVECMKEPTFITKTKAMGMDLAPGSRDKAAKFFAEERELWSKVANEAGIKPVH
jgi:tripartite-type tricarboxylate transporter receptor subunit TctC